MSSHSVQVNGCLPIILTCIIAWALIFGVTYEGKHYGLNCSCAHGVEVEK
jgi:hypothetical protein